MITTLQPVPSSSLTIILYLLKPWRSVSVPSPKPSLVHCTTPRRSFILHGSVTASPCFAVVSCGSSSKDCSPWAALRSKGKNSRRPTVFQLVDLLAATMFIVENGGLRRVHRKGLLILGVTSLLRNTSYFLVTDLQLVHLAICEKEAVYK